MRKWMVQTFGSKGRNRPIQFIWFDHPLWPMIHGPWTMIVHFGSRLPSRYHLWDRPLLYYNITIFWNVKGAFCPAGEPSIRTKPCDLTTQPCDDCYNQYDKCDRISTSYCTDVRYADRLERLCQKHCGHCSSRKRRRRRRIQSEDTASYQALDALLIGLSLR